MVGVFVVIGDGDEAPDGKPGAFVGVDEEAKEDVCSACKVSSQFGR